MRPSRSPAQSSQAKLIAALVSFFAMLAIIVTALYTENTYRGQTTLEAEFLLGGLLSLGVGNWLYQRHDLSLLEGVMSAFLSMAFAILLLHALTGVVIRQTAHEPYTYEAVITHWGRHKNCKALATVRDVRLNRDIKFCEQVAKDSGAVKLRIRGATGWLGSYIPERQPVR